MPPRGTSPLLYFPFLGKYSKFFHYKSLKFLIPCEKENKENADQKQTSRGAARLCFDLCWQGNLLDCLLCRTRRIIIERKGAG